MPVPTAPSARSTIRRVRGAVLGLALLAVFASAISACGDDGDSASASRGGGGEKVLKWAEPWFSEHWDPVVAGSGAQFRQLALVYSALTKIDEQGKPVPDLAESWDYNKKGDEVTFHLRSGLKFSDGTPLDGAAVKAAIERAKTQKDSALFGDLGSIESVTADGQDVIVHLTQVDYQIPALLGARVLLIASPKAAKDPKKLDQNPIGAGPFVITQFIPGTKALLKKNPDYWDADNIHIDKVELTSAPDPAAVVAGLRTGAYNFTEQLEPSQAKAAKDAGLDVVVQPGFNAENISLNINKKPFDDPKVVDAIRYGINRKEFVDKVSFGYGEATDQLFPPGFVGYDPQSKDRWPYNPQKAKQLLSEAGYESGEIKLDFVIERATISSEIIQSQLAAIGITTKIKVDKNWDTPFFAKQLTLSAYGTTGRDSPVQTLTAHFGKDGPLNLSSPFVPEGFDEAIARIRETPLDDPDYAKNLQAATRAGLESRALIFTLSTPNLLVKSKSISDPIKAPGHVELNGVTIGG